MTHRHSARPRKATSFGALLVISVVIGVLASCDTLLDIEAPSRVPGEFLDDPANADLLLASAIADFECAFAEYIAAGGLMGDELVDGQLAARMWPYDRRSADETDPVYSTFTCNDPDPGVYQTLSTARFTAERAMEVIEDPAQVATAAAYAGYTYVLLGEAMCSAAVDAGPELSKTDLFQLADERFTTAIAGAPVEIVNMAQVGRARARLDLGDLAGALSDAQAVPEGFERLAEYNAASFRSSNRLWTLNNRDERVSVENDFWSVGDPRVAVQDMGRVATSDDSTPLWVQMKYPSQDSSIPIATWEEAQLIIAEAQGGQAAVTIFNDLRSRAGAGPVSGTTDEEIRDLLIQERGIELWLESHHLFDKVRFGLDFTPPAGTVYQEGSAAKGGFYGSVSCLPLPRVERVNNPNIP